MAEIIIVHGADGAGKTTQSKRLAEFLGGTYVGTGDLCRASNDPEILEDLRHGRLPSPKKVAALLEAELSLHDGIIILDGSPRKPEDLKLFDTMVRKLNYTVAKVLVIQVSEDVSRARLRARGRNADTSDGIETRMRWFREDTSPVIDTFRNRGLVTDINGDADPDTVFAELKVQALCVRS